MHCGGPPAACNKSQGPAAPCYVHVIVANMEQHTPLQLVLWLCIALLAHVLVALFGVLNRWLQTRPSPPLPAMRAALLVSMLALGSVAAVDASTRAAGWLLRRRRQRSSVAREQEQRQQQQQQPMDKEMLCLPVRSCVGAKQQQQQQQQGAEACMRKAAEGSEKSSLTGAVLLAAAGASAADAAAAAGQLPAGGCAAGSAAAPGGQQPHLPPSPFETEHGTAQQQQQSQQQQAQSQQQPQSPSSPPCGRCDDSSSSARAERFSPSPHTRPLPPPRPELALQRGLSQRVRALQRGRPRLVRLGALAVITATFACAYLCQVIAPGFVDPALIQLVMIWTVIGVALFQRLLLHHRLPLIIWPCSAAMLGGACMVIVPTVGRGSTAGLDDWRGWLGFGLSVLSMLSTVIYFVSLQASRRMAFTSLQLQYLFLLASILLLLPLTLPIDGTDWAAQFRGWTAHDWGVLFATAGPTCVGANWSIQHATWQLGAPTVSMFFGLRLVFSILESKLLLQATIITEPLQIAGTVVTVCSVSIYLWWQWRLSRQQARLGATASSSSNNGTKGSGS